MAYEAKFTDEAVAYLGIGRVFPFLKATNEILEEQGVQLPFIGYPRTLNAFAALDAVAKPAGEDQ